MNFGIQRNIIQESIFLYLCVYFTILTASQETLINLTSGRYILLTDAQYMVKNNNRKIHISFK